MNDGIVKGVTQGPSKCHSIVKNNSHRTSYSYQMLFSFSLQNRFSNVNNTQQLVVVNAKWRSWKQTHWLTWVAITRQIQCCGYAGSLLTGVLPLSSPFCVLSTLYLFSLLVHTRTLPSPSYFPTLVIPFSPRLSITLPPHLNKYSVHLASQWEQNPFHYQLPLHP